jgi:hypothetical protein
MKLSEYKLKIKKEMGLRWYWLRFKLLFDFEHQYNMWLLKKELRLTTALNKHREKIKKYYGN